MRASEDLRKRGLGWPKSEPKELVTMSRPGQNTFIFGSVNNDDGDFVLLGLSLEHVVECCHLQHEVWILAVDTTHAKVAVDVLDDDDAGNFISLDENLRQKDVQRECCSRLGVLRYEDVAD
mmetsp:Transcript_1553/g.4680  ORF Transcript_1553/g.4680 Transcript_1553/m.4680 type:complete len:121 (-) Transcript_1553:26-388(-)